MRAGEKLLNALFIFLEHVKTWNSTLTTHSRSCFFEVLIVQCQNIIKYIFLCSLSAAMFTWPCKTNFTTVPDPLELQILLEDQTATEILFQSYAATTTIDRMTWLARISHYVRGHVHKTGHKYNGTTTSGSPSFEDHVTKKRRALGTRMALSFILESLVAVVVVVVIMQASLPSHINGP